MHHCFKGLIHFLIQKRLKLFGNNSVKLHQALLVFLPQPIHILLHCSQDFLHPCLLLCLCLSQMISNNRNLPHRKFALPGRLIQEHLILVV